MTEPAAWQQKIMDEDFAVTHARPIGVIEPPTYMMEFYSEDGLGLATITVLGPLYIPSVGEQIKLHDVPLTVKAVRKEYDGNSDNGNVGVFVSVVVAHAENWQDIF